MKTIYLIPNNLGKCCSDIDVILSDHYGDDLPSPSSFSQELRLWTSHWSSITEKPGTILDTLKSVSYQGLEQMFPNILTILRMLLTMPSTSASVERANSSLKYVKNKYRSRMSEPRLNSLILMYVHKDIILNSDELIDMYARRHPRRMLFINPLGDE